MSIATGDDHAILLDSERKIWGYGSNNNKQINPKSDSQFFKTFVKLEYPHDV